MGKTLNQEFEKLDMGQLGNEVQIWNTPTVGAYLLWRFTSGYINNHVEGEAPIGLLLFIATAILTNTQLIKPISNRRENLQSYANSFETSKEVDLILSIHDRVSAYKSYTLAAIDIALEKGLLAWDTASGQIYAADILNSNQRYKSPKGAIVKDGYKAEILGKWFSKHDLLTIAAYLKVVF